MIRGDLGDTLKGGGITTRLEFVAWGAPDWNACEPNPGWELATYQLTTTYPDDRIGPPHVMTANGNTHCWITDSNTQYEVTGKTYVYVIPQKPGSTAVYLDFEKPGGVRVVFKFR